VSDDPNWRTARLDELCDINPPKPALARVAEETEVLFVPMASVDEISGTVVHREVSTVGLVGRKSYRSFAPGDVLFAKITPCMENGKAAIVPPIPSGLGFGSTEFHVLRPKPGTDARLIWHFVRQQAFRDEAAQHFTGTVGQLRVPADFLRSYEALVPVSRKDQADLATLLDEAVGSTASASTHLSLARAAVERFRRAVLAAACSGRLTADWREQDSDGPFESAGSLVKQIRAQLTTATAAPAAALPSTADDFPETWEVLSLDSLTTRITSGSRDWSRYYGRGSATFVMAQNVRRGMMDWSLRQAVDPPPSDPSRERSQIMRGDLLVTIVGANTGDVAPVVDDRPQHFVCQSVALARPAIQGLSAYLSLWFNSEQHGRGYLNDRAYGAGRPHLSFDQLRAAPVFLPSFAEQAEIVRRVEALLTSADSLSARVDLAAQLVDRTSQSVLANAFRGEMLPSARESS
jgi:type I restriction enzyme S subunit